MEALEDAEDVAAIRVDESEGGPNVRWEDVEGEPDESARATPAVRELFERSPPS